MPRPRASAAASEHVDPRSTYRKGYRGYLMMADSINQVVKCAPSTFTRAKLAAFPAEFYWPGNDDFDGAQLLIDAVLARDVPAIRRLNAQHPEFDFKLGEWYTKLAAEHTAAAAVKRQTLRSVPLGIGRTLRVELETDSRSGLRTLRRSIYRGDNRFASDILATETNHKVTS